MQDMPVRGCEEVPAAKEGGTGSPEAMDDVAVQEEVQGQGEVRCEDIGGVAGGWAYLAGFFDGEGTISRAATGWQWSVAQSHERGLRVLERLRQFLFSQGIKSVVYRRRTVDKCNCLYITDRPTILKVIKGMMPFLIVKKVECQDMWRYDRIFPAVERGPILGMRIREGRRRGINARGFDRPSRAN